MAAEIIKSEGFSFLQLTGTYAQSKTHRDAYKLFAQSVEELIRHEIKDYIVAVSEKQEAKPDAELGVDRPATQNLKRKSQRLHRTIRASRETPKGAIHANHHRTHQHQRLWAKVANLQDGLSLLLDRGAIRPFDPPNSPTAEELAKLAKQLAEEERPQLAFGKAT